jgi:hypothetical protein
LSTQNALFGAALVASLAFLSLLIRMRMRGSGRPPREVWAAIGELWLTFAAITTVLWAGSRMLGAARGGDAVGEFTDIGRRFAALDSHGKAWVLVGGALALLLFVRLVALLRRYMEGPAERGGSE